MSNSPDSKAKKVAVIAVHGVSDQQPFDSARQVANLLRKPETRPHDRYTPFLEKFIVIPVHSIKIEPPIEIADQQSINSNQTLKARIVSYLQENHPKIYNILYGDEHSIIPDERGEFIHQHIKKKLKVKPKKELTNKTKNYDVDIDLTRDYLSRYEQYTVYETICLDGNIKKDNPDQENNPGTKVHIYEMYWADLSRLGTGFIRIFGELYQLLFHLISIGRPVVDLARINIRENQDISLEKRKALDDKLTSWGRWQLWTGRFLSLGIPTLNVFLLIST